VEAGFFDGSRRSYGWAGTGFQKMVLIRIATRVLAMRSRCAAGDRCTPQIRNELSARVGGYVSALAPGPTQVARIAKGRADARPATSAIALAQ